MDSFADVLKRLREKAGLTQAGLAQKSGLSLGVIRDYEQGRKEPALRSAFKLAEALHTTVAAFKDCVDIDNPPAEELPKKDTKKKKGKN